MTDVAVREAGAQDHAAVAALLRAAFGQKDEAALVETLRRNHEFDLELVAEADGAVVGYIGFVFIGLVRNGVPGGAYQLVPLAVAPERQRQGVGAALTRAGLERLELEPGRLVFVLGHPEYYARFGFSAALAERYRAPWSGPAFMAYAEDQESAPPAGRLIVPDAFLAA